MSITVTTLWDTPTMKALASIRRSRTLRNTKAGPNSIKKCWPCPEKSVGRFITNIGRQSCWEATGPARATFLTIGPLIKQHLDTYSEPTPTWITWSIYMVGAAPETAAPTIIFCCEDESLRKRIRDTIRDSIILERHSGIALKHLPRAPDYNQLVQLASSSAMDNTEALDMQNPIPFGPLVFSTSRHPTMGQSLYIGTENHAGSTRKATAGGIIRIHGIDCLLTAAHAFNDTPMQSSNPGHQDEDLCFSDSDDGGDSMSAANYSSGLSHPLDTDILPSPRSSWSSSVTVPLKPEDAALYCVTANKDIGKYAETEDEPVVGIRGIQLPEYASHVGDTLFLSTEGTKEGLDYGLVRLRNGSLDASRNDDLVFPDLMCPNTSRYLTSDLVFAHTASAGVVSGSISMTPTYMRLPNATAYQEVRHIKLKEPLANGDCGSWVFDALSNSLHGHIVAGSPDSGSAYIIPAYQVFEDIQQHVEVIKQRLEQLEKLERRQRSDRAENLQDAHPELPHTLSINTTQLWQQPDAEPPQSFKSAMTEDIDPAMSFARPLRRAGKSVQLRYLESASPEIISPSEDCCEDENSNPENAQSFDITSTSVVVSPSAQTQSLGRASVTCNQDIVMEATVAEELTSRFRALLSQKRVQTLRNLKAQAEDQLPPYSAIRNIPFVPVPPAGARAIRFKNMLFCFSNMPTRWENPGLLDEALQSVELGKIYDDAEVEYQIFEAEAQSLQSDKKAAWGYQDCVARALLRWFKRSFFTFVNNPPCSRCYSPTVVLGLTPPLPEEQSNGAKHVEHYKCSYQGCGNFERFPRYSDPFVLMRTRRGRCGEWANCFGMLCRAIGCRVRWVWNAEDYVWVEVYSLHRKRWVHVDPLEEVWDNPLIYTNSWGKPLSYCIAFSADGAEDVTRRYVRNAKFALDRFRSTESELLHIINDIRAVRHQKLGKADRMRLEGERIKEQRELQCQTIGELVRDLCSLSLVKLADGSIGIFEAWSTKAKENTPGQTGSASTATIETLNREIR